MNFMAIILTRTDWVIPVPVLVFNRPYKRPFFWPRCHFDVSRPRKRLLPLFRTDRHKADRAAFRLSCGACFEPLAFVFASGVALHLLHFCYETARGTLQKRGT